MDKLSGNVFGGFKLLEYVTRGTYGCIYKAQEDPKGTPGSTDSNTKQTVFAAKVIDIKNISEKERDQANREIELLKTTGKECHPNIVAYKTNVFQGDTVCIVMEFCNGGNLYNYIQQLYKEKKTMTEQDFIDKLTQIASGVEFLHGKDMIHRDLKTKNILLSDGGRVKIADFGLARYIDPKNKFRMTSQVGTPLYMSPEMIDEKTYDKMTDVWSLGCTCYEMATGHFAFQEESLLKMKDIFSKKHFPDMSSIGYRDALTRLITRMLSYTSSKRLTMTEILQELEGLDTTEKHTVPDKDRTTRTKSSYMESSPKSSQTSSQRQLTQADIQNREYLEKQSETLQQSLLSQIGGYKAAETLVTIKQLMQQGTDAQFEEQAVQILGKEMFQRLNPVLLALHSIEKGIRDLKSPNEQSLKFRGMDISLRGHHDITK